MSDSHVDKSVVIDAKAGVVFLVMAYRTLTIDERLAVVSRWLARCETPPEPGSTVTIMTKIGLHRSTGAPKKD